ncbi:MAG: acyl-CoA dehydrogenase family protein [Alphaproteobacteria bacterium]|nr:acyl-CoA dehydrogenase family protein [Alphaproteobacteria bacterium]MDP6814273.1 acyl-CoA dehydrogenase family protein [Alphaproteobacteria bacterium]
MLLNEQQTMVRDMAREFAQRELAPNAPDWDRAGELPAEVLSRMGELGLLGMCVDEEWGGAGADYLSYAVALEEIAAGDAATSNVMGVNNVPVCAAIVDYGNDGQKARFLRPLASGAHIGAFLLTEPQAGSDASNLRTRARRQGDRYIINGDKQFITSGSIASTAMIFAVTDPEAGGRGISCFLTPTDAAGYKVARIEDKMGQRASDTCHIVLEDLEVPVENRLGEEGEGYRIALANLSTGRIGVSCQAIGMARAAFEQALAYAQEREAFGKVIFEHQAVAFRLAEMATSIETARQLTHHAASLHMAGETCRKEASMAKLFASEMAEQVCSDAVQTFGGYGYLNDLPVERIYRDVRVTQIYEGTSDIQKLLISRAIRDEV